MKIMFNRNILAVKEAQLNALVAESGGQYL